MSKNRLIQLESKLKIKNLNLYCIGYCENDIYNLPDNFFIGCGLNPDSYKSIKDENGEQYRELTKEQKDKIKIPNDLFLILFEVINGNRR